MSLTQNWLEKGLNLYICTNIDYIYFSNLFFSLDFEDYKILMPSHPILSRCDVLTQNLVKNSPNLYIMYKCL